MPRYLVYGLEVHSNQEIPGLVAVCEANHPQPEVRVHLGCLPVWLEQPAAKNLEQREWYVSGHITENGKPALRIWQILGAPSSYFWLQYSDGTEFVLDRYGSEIWAIWSDELTVEDTATYLLGPILGWVLRLRGSTCLHASGVVVENRVLAFLGDAGAGKSTTAAAFAQQGYPILSDDVLALVDREGSFWVQPAYPRVRLWSESVVALYGSVEKLPRIVPSHPTWDKRYLDLSQQGYQFQNSPLPLAVIYILHGRREEVGVPKVESPSSSEALISLIANTYGSYLLDKSMRSQEFQLLGRLLKSVTVRQVIPHKNPEYIPQLIETILNDFQSQPRRR